MTLRGPADGAGADQDTNRLLNREVAAGLFLILLAGLSFFGALSLDFGSLRSIGSGLVPRTTAIILAGFGVLIALQGLRGIPERLGGVNVRGLVFVLGAVLVFAATIRTLGLAVAAPAAIMISALADPDTRPRELALFTIIFSVLSVILFKFVLRLPIPLMPPLLGY